MPRSKGLKGLTRAAAGAVRRASKNAVPHYKNVRRIRNLDIPKRPPLPKPNATSASLRNVVDNLWKHVGKTGTVGDGTTFDAYRNELLTGRRSNGINHRHKVLQSMRAIEKIINNPSTSDGDRQIADDLLRRFSDSFGRGWG